MIWIQMFSLFLSCCHFSMSHHSWQQPQSHRIPALPTPQRPLRHHQGNIMLKPPARGLERLKTGPTCISKVGGTSDMAQNFQSCCCSGR